MASQKLTFLQKIDPNSMKTRVEALKSQGLPDASTVAPPTRKPPVSPEIFAGIGDAALEAPEATFVFRITAPDAAWTVQVAGEVARATAGELNESTAVLSLSDDDLGALARGETSAQVLFQNGKLRIDGDVLAAQRLDFLNRTK